MTASLRLFFALELSATDKTTLLNFQQRLSLLGGQKIPAENFHITLSFLGQIAESKIESLLDEIETPDMQPFEISTGDILYFEGAKTLALSIEKGAEKLSQLKRIIEKNLQRIEHFNLDKRVYKPHISLLKQLQQYPDQLPPYHMPIKVIGISLLASVPTKKGVGYELIGEWPLRASKSVKEMLLGK